MDKTGNSVEHANAATTEPAEPIAVREPRWVLPVVLAVTTVGCLPALWCGRYLDDWQQQEILRGQFEVLDEDSPFIEFYTFASGNPEQTRQRVEQSRLPWWTDPELKMRFLRPLSVLPHLLDEWLWPESVRLMHAHSLLWYLFAVMAAALAYRALGSTAVGVGLAIFLFAIDDLHAVTIGWLANRNLPVTAVFVLLGFRLHIHWQQEGRSTCGIAAALLFALALLTGESAVTYGAFVAAWTITRHPGPLRQRVLSLLPGVLIGIVWLVAYRHFGFGASESAQYVNPVGEPLQFFAAAAERMPLLLAALLGTSSATLSPFADAGERLLLWYWAAFSAAGIVLVLVPYVWRDQELRFWSLATLISLLPLCAATPIDRVLLLCSFASHGLIARFLVLAWSVLKQHVPESAQRADSPRVARVGSAVAWLLMLLHIVTPLWLLPVRIGAFQVQGRRQEAAAVSPVLDQPLEDRHVILINPPDMFYGWSLPRIRTNLGLSTPERVRVLATGVAPLELERQDDHVLIIRPQAPFLTRAFADVYRRKPLTAAWTRKLDGLKIEVLEVDDAGEPTVISFRFDQSLDSDSLLWMQWHEGGFIPLNLPRTGQSISLPAQVESHWFGLEAMLDFAGL